MSGDDRVRWPVGPDTRRCRWGGGGADTTAAGTGGAGASTGASAGSSAPETASGVSTAAGTAPAGATTVTFWQNKFEDYQQKWFGANVKKFNESQDKVHVNYIVVPGDVWDQKLKAAQAAGTQPDVATTNYGSIRAGVDEGKFADLGSLMPAETLADIKDNVKSFVQVDGKNYAYPMLVEPSTVLYYRTDLVKAAGLDPTKPPKTWDELLTWADKLTTDKVKGMTIASTAPDLQWSSWGLQYNACGYLPVTGDWSAARATDPCFQKLLTFYQTLFQKKYIPQQPKVGYPDATPYLNGEVAMMANGSWAVGQIKDGKKMLDKTAVAAFPSVDGDASKPAATLGGWTLTVDSKSKNQQAAADFIKWLLADDPQRMADFFKLSGFSKFTVRSSVDKALASTPAATNDPFMKIISDQVVAHGKAEPGYPIDMSKAFADAIEGAMKGKSDIPTALKTANDTIDRTIKQQRLAGKGPGGN
jgi:multiple sugar transport system substrate-binding protein